MSEKFSYQVGNMRLSITVRHEVYLDGRDLRDICYLILEAMIVII